MKQPVAELDTRFSDQDAVATDWEERLVALEDAELFWISTVRADRRPHVMPPALDVPLLKGGLRVARSGRRGGGAGKSYFLFRRTSSSFVNRQGSAQCCSRDVVSRPARGVAQARARAAALGRTRLLTKA